MSEMEREELICRIGAMSLEEKELVVRLFPSEILYQEINRRDQISREVIHSIRSTLRMAE